MLAVIHTPQRPADVAIGGYGPVYRGVLDGVPVAVKLLEPGGISSQGHKEFSAEVTILSRLHHPHIVLLMGSCPERCALVYELMDYGNLEQHLLSPVYPDLRWQVGTDSRDLRRSASITMLMHSKHATDEAK